MYGGPRHERSDTRSSLKEYNLRAISNTERGNVSEVQGDNLRQDVELRSRFQEGAVVGFQPNRQLLPTSIC